MCLKPCIECGKDCEILPVQLGDIFTLTYLRVCSGECMFLIAYAFIRGLGEHQQFRNDLYDMQNEEDKENKIKFIDEVTKESLDRMKKHLEENSLLLSYPVPTLISEMFSNGEPFPPLSGKTMRFTRPTKEKRIEWADQRVQRLQQDLFGAMKELERIKNE